MGRRWIADDSLRAGIVHQACEGDKLLHEAFSYAEKHGKMLAKSRAAFARMKMQTKGYVAKELFGYNKEDIELTRASMPAGLLRHAEALAKNASKYPSVLPWAAAKL